MGRSLVLLFFFCCSLAALCTRQPAIKMDAWLNKKKKPAKDQANTANSQNTVPEGGQLENELANVSKATSSEKRHNDEECEESGTSGCFRPDTGAGTSEDLGEQPPNKKRKTRPRPYKDYFLKYGFVNYSKTNQEARPMCVICSKKTRK